MRNFPFLPLTRPGLVLALGLAAGLPLAASPAAPSATLDPLTEALPALQAHYVDYAKLQVQPQDHLGDLIARSGDEMSLGPSTPAITPAPILTTLLPQEAVYCRLSSFTPAGGWAGFTAQLDKWLGDGAQGIVLDLRSNGAPNDFDGAAQLAGFFTPAGAPLFTVQDAQGHAHSYAGVGSDPLLLAPPIAVLIDHRTSGAAEALAACLQANGAVLIGQKTQGQGAVFEDAPLASGQSLHYLSGQVTMADGAPLWHAPVLPDIHLVVDDKKEQTLLDLIAQNRILDVIRDVARSHRLSEAALVRGEDPEIEAYLTPHDKKPAVVIPLDVVLVDALDSLTAIRLSQRTVAAPADEVSGPELPSTVQ